MRWARSTLSGGRGRTHCGRDYLQMALCLGAEVPNRALIRWRGESQTKAPEFEFEDSVSPPDARQKQLTQLDYYLFMFFSAVGGGG